MNSKLRIWRVQPVKNGAKAPYFFVETTESNREKAVEEATSLAKSKSGLSRFNTWKFLIEKEKCRVDKFGRYIKYYQ